MVLAIHILSSVRSASTRLASHFKWSMTRHIGSFTVQPAVSHVSEEVQIRGKGFHPGKDLTVRCSVEVPSQDLDFVSHTHIRISSDGTFDLSTSHSEGGSYTGVHPMGLFWSMTSNHPDGIDRMQFTDASVQMAYNFQLYDGFVNEFENTNCFSECSAKRLIIDDQVKRVKIREGRVRGTLFIPPGKGPFPAIIYMQGGTKNKQIQEDVSAFLAANGFISLALAYFNVDDLPKTIKKLDLEYFEEAVEMLLKLENASGKIGIYGLSKGGDLALAMMTYLRQVDAVVWVMGFLGAVGGTISYKGLVNEPFNMNWEQLKTIAEQRLNFKGVIGDPRNQPSAIYPFYKSRADLLMIAGLDDQLIDSPLFCDVAEDVMKATGKNNFAIRKYEHLGHLVDLPHSPVCLYKFHPVIQKPNMLFYGGEQKAGHAASQLQMWQDVLTFFKNSLF